MDVQWIAGRTNYFYEQQISAVYLISVLIFPILKTDHPWTTFRIKVHWLRILLKDETVSTYHLEHEDKLWRDTEKFKETIQKKDTELRRNEDAKRKMAADLKTKLQEKERGRILFRCYFWYQSNKTNINYLNNASIFSQNYYTTKSNRKVLHKEKGDNDVGDKWWRRTIIN